MRETDSPKKDTDTQDPGLGMLLRLAAPRTDIEDERQERVIAAVKESWRHNVAARRRQKMRRRLGVGLAASMIVAVLGALFQFSVLPPESSLDSAAPGLAQAAYSTGDVIVVNTGESLSAGHWLSSGAQIRTGAEGRATLHLGTGVELRLDVETTLRLDAERRITLLSGAVYVDTSWSGSRPLPEPRAVTASKILVSTPFGEAVDIGTRFEVRVRQRAVTVRVREGKVELSSDDSEFDIDSGEELTLEKGGKLARRALRPFASEWSWTFEAAPEFDLHGRAAGEFFDWVAREAGWTLRLDDRLAKDTREIELRGSISGLSPLDALVTVLPTLGLDYEITEGELRLLT